jgi:hypothetical protein
VARVSWCAERIAAPGKNFGDAADTRNVIILNVRRFLMLMDIEVFFNTGDVVYFKCKSMKNDKIYIPSIKYEGAFVIITTDILGSTLAIPQSRIREIKTIQLEKVL